MANMIARNFMRSKPWLFCQEALVRSKSSSTQPPTETVKMSKHVELWKMTSVPQSVPLVLIFPWLQASQAAIQKYANLYHQRGMDVLVVKGTWTHSLWPPNALKLGHELDKCLKEIPTYEKFFVHCFSAGAYNYTIVQMNTISGVLNFPLENVICQIYDSIAIGTIDNMAEGIANSMTNNKLLRRILKKLSFLYLKAIKSKTIDLLEESIQFLKDKFLPVPSLFFYSENDPICNVASMKKLLVFLKGKYGDDIWEKSWPISVHTAHLLFHQDDYVSVWKQFISKSGFSF